MPDAIHSSVFLFLEPHDYCNFMKLVASAKFRKHHSAKQIPAYVSKKGIVGYAQSYDGIFGQGWKIVIANHGTSHNCNSLVIYWVR